jgi:ABC-2 type transport system permease protein
VKRLVQAELLGARSTRSTTRFVAAAWALALFLVVNFLGVRGLEDAAARDALTAVSSASSAGVVLLLLAAASMSGETRHRTLPGALLADSGRVRFVLAKAAAMALLATAAGLVAVLLAIAFVTIALGIAGGELPAAADLAETAARSTGYCTLMAVLGAGVGAVVRSQTAAVALPLVFLLVFEPLLAAVSEVVARWGVGGAGAALIGGEGSDLLPGAAGGALLAAYAAACVAAGAAVVRRRDVL